MAVSAFAISQGLRASGTGGLLGAALVPIATVGVPVWLGVSTRYILSDRELLIRAGPLRWRVPLQEINVIEPTRNPLSSPALSFDRLRIDYARGRSVMISPRNKDAFLRDIEARRAALN